MDTRCAQLLMPLLLLSDWYFLANISKELRGSKLIIWLIPIYRDCHGWLLFLLHKTKIPLSWYINQPFFYLKIYFGRM